MGTAVKPTSLPQVLVMAPQMVAMLRNNNRANGDQDSAETAAVVLRATGRPLMRLLTNQMVKQNQMEVRCRPRSLSPK